MRGWWMLVGLVLSGPASAQDDFRLDAVLVAPFVATPSELGEDAALLRARVEEALSVDNVLVPLADVPDMPGGTPADLYVLACPDAQYDGCAFALGEHAGADWVVGGEVRPVVGALSLTLRFVEVSSARVLLVTELEVEDPRDGVVGEQAAGLLAAVLSGAIELVDLRIDRSTVIRAEAMDDQELEEAAQELDALEDELGEAERDDRRRGRRERLTLADLAAYEGRDDATPWDDLGLTKAQYVRMRNDGVDLPTFRRRLRGRMGELRVGGTAFTLGTGPWTQVSETWYARNALTLELADQIVVEDLDEGFWRAWEIDVGFGVLPWLDVGGFFGPQLITWRGRVQPAVEGEELRLREPVEQVATTWHAGGRVQVAPGPAWPARPVVGVGVRWWSGRPRSDFLVAPDGVVEVQKPWLLFLEVTAGAEVDIDRWLQLWARADLDFPLAGAPASEVRRGGALLPGAPSARSGDEPLAVGASLGFTFRIRLRPKWTPSPRRVE